jgi:preprotein translocase subunit Sss1
MSTAEEQKLEIRITRVEDTLGRMASEIMDLQEVQSDIRALALSVNSLAGEVKHLVEDMCKTTQRVDRMESKPAQRWDRLIEAIIVTAVGGLIGYMIAMILK